jgi:hypothetical protein
MAHEKITGKQARRSDFCRGDALLAHAETSLRSRREVNILMGSFLGW